MMAGRAIFHEQPGNRESCHHLYNRIKELHQEARQLRKGLVFELVFEPLNPLPGEVAESHFLDFRNCFDEDDNTDRVLLPSDLTAELEMLEDYAMLLHGVNISIEGIIEEYKDDYNVRLLQIVDARREIVESDTDEEDAEQEWQEDFASDSGQESQSDLESVSPLNSSSQSKADSGLQTDSVDESEFEHLQDSLLEEESQNELPPELILEIGFEVDYVPELKDDELSSTTAMTSDDQACSSACKHKCAELERKKETEMLPEQGVELHPEGSTIENSDKAADQEFIPKPHCSKEAI